jgi:hypothetical protein
MQVWSQDRFTSHLLNRSKCADRTRSPGGGLGRFYKTPWNEHGSGKWNPGENLKLGEGLI